MRIQFGVSFVSIRFNSSILDFQPRYRSATFNIGINKKSDIFYKLIKQNDDNSFQQYLRRIITFKRLRYKYPATAKLISSSNLVNRVNFLRIPNRLY